MKFVSTRGVAPPVGLSEAIAAGLAPDGGLYVPTELPLFTQASFLDADTLPAVAERLLAPFFADDAMAASLPAICREAFSFPAPLHPIGEGDHLLELFHGPTAAFKDFGARFLAACLRRIAAADGRERTILVATSGDTGAAVAAAFHGSPGLRVVVLYPDGRVSPRQAHQLGAFGGNVRTYRVAGSFDDCQALVKRALADTELQARLPLSSANSISLGRLLPQMAYYAQSSLLHQRQRGEALNFVVPTGNLGNAFAAVLARSLGLPIGRIVLATNANRVLPEFFAGGGYAPRASIATLANAMDVGAPSNFERLRWLFPEEIRLREALAAVAVNDEGIRASIVAMHRRLALAICPHTATAAHALARLRLEGIAGAWAIAATAHPAKFESIVEPLLGQTVDVPPALVELLSRSSRAEPLGPDFQALRQQLLAGTGPR
jgi:threonine synthase